MTTPLSGLLRFAWTFVWAAHAIGAVAWWWSMPQGFPPGHMKFLANTVVPAVLFLVAMSTLGAALKPNVNWVASFAAFPLIFWMLLGSAWYRLCPLSIVRYGPFVAPGLLLLFLLWFQTRRAKGGMTLLSLTSTLVAAGSGVAFGFAQRGPEPSTTPYKPQVFIIVPERGARVENAKRPFSFDGDTGQVSVQREGVTLHVLPLLSFMSRSPDRCWSNLAPKGTNAVQRQVMGVRETTELVSARYLDDGQSALLIGWNDEKSLPVAIEALTGLDHPIYSHINAYCILSLKGLKDPRVAFSPCAQTALEILPSDYPTGRPARFAYLDASNTLHAVEARTGEKGPFKELAAGPLKPGESLTLTFYDGENARIAVALDDFAAQASRALSPTAGWGVAQNAIEFSREADGSVSVWFTLAGTGIGRGWDTVGHGTGTYRNRVRIVAPE